MRLLISIMISASLIINDEIYLDIFFGNIVTAKVENR